MKKILFLILAFMLFGCSIVLDDPALSSKKQKEITALCDSTNLVHLIRDEHDEKTFLVKKNEVIKQIDDEMIWPPVIMFFLVFLLGMALGSKMSDI